MLQPPRALGRHSCASLSSSPAGRLTLAHPHLTCDAIPRTHVDCAGLDPFTGSGRAFTPGGLSGGRRTLDLFTRSPGRASGVVAHSSARFSTCAALMLDESGSMVDRMCPVRWAEVGLGESNATWTVPPLPAKACAELRKFKLCERAPRWPLKKLA